MARRRETATEVQCPRCAYDVSGAIPTWTTQCPLEGTCSECGMVYRWARLLGPTGYAPKWLFEYATRRRLRSIGTTALRAWIPWKFWRAVPIELPVRPGRLLVFAAAWAALLYTAVGFYAALIGLQWGAGFFTGFTPLLVGQPITDSLIAGAMWPTLLTDEEYSWIIFSCQGKYLCLLVMWLAVIPFAFAPVSHTLRVARVRWSQLFRIQAYAAGGLIAFIWYGWLAPVVPLLIWIAGVRYGRVPRPPAWIESALLPVLAISTPVLAGIWLVVFWWLAIARYLRLPHPRAVTALLLLAAFLAALSVLCYWPHSGVLQDAGNFGYFLETGSWPSPFGWW